MNKNDDSFNDTSFRYLLEPLKKFRTVEIEDAIAKGIAELTGAEWECHIDMINYHKAKSMKINLMLSEKTEPFIKGTGN